VADLAVSREVVAMNLVGRHALITGGSSGIGLAIAQELASAGSHVHIAARRPEALQAALANLSVRRVSSAQRFEAHACDVALESDVTNLFARLGEAESVPSIVVNSAGMTCAGYLQELATEQFERTMQVNFFGTLYVTRAAAAVMLPRGQGHIMNISSVAGMMGVFGMAPYCASKFAVNGFTEVVRSELKAHGIAVTLLCPPDTDTPMLVIDAGNPPETRALSASGGVLSAEHVARDAVRGMLRGRAVVVPGREAKLVTLAHRLAPGLVERVEEWIIRRAVHPA
jgi:3-dehydrosphinganine reductase